MTGKETSSLQPVVGINSRLRLTPFRTSAVSIDAFRVPILSGDAHKQVPVYELLHANRHGRRSCQTVRFRSCSMYQTRMHGNAKAYQVTSLAG